MGFLQPNDPWANDLVVQHVVSSPPSFDLDASLGLQQQMNRRILHLTTEADPDAVTWPVSVIYAEMRKAMEDLVQEMEIETSEYLPRFVEAMRGNPVFRKIILI